MRLLFWYFYGAIECVWLSVSLSHQHVTSETFTQAKTKCWPTSLNLLMKCIKQNVFWRRRSCMFEDDCNENHLAWLFGVRGLCASELKLVVYGVGGKWVGGRFKHDTWKKNINLIVLGVFGRCVGMFPDSYLYIQYDATVWCCLKLLLCWYLSNPSVHFAWWNAL